MYRQIAPRRGAASDLLRRLSKGTLTPELRWKLAELRVDQTDDRIFFLGAFILYIGKGDNCNAQQGRRIANFNFVVMFITMFTIEFIWLIFILID